MAARGRPRTFDRQEALNSAVDVFLARGFDGATLDDLTAAMGGIAPPSFYAAFESKENLFREAIQLYAATAGSRGREALDGPKVREAIEGLLRESTDAFTVPNRPGGCLVLLGAASCARANKDTHDFLRSDSPAAADPDPEAARTRHRRRRAAGEPRRRHGARRSTSPFCTASRSARATARPARCCTPRSTARWRRGRR